MSTRESIDEPGHVDSVVEEETAKPGKNIMNRLKKMNKKNKQKITSLGNNLKDTFDNMTRAWN